MILTGGETSGQRIRRKWLATGLGGVDLCSGLCAGIWSSVVGVRLRSVHWVLRGSVVARSDIGGVGLRAADHRLVIDIGLAIELVQGVLSGVVAVVVVHSWCAVYGTRAASMAGS